MAKITHGYWDLRGLAEPIRYLLHHKKVEFEDKRYSFDEDKWNQEKFNLGLDFPNLPYMFDGDVRISQSTTILRYLAHKYNLEGNTPQEKIRVSLAEQQLLDIRANWGKVCYNPDFENLKADFVKNAAEQFKLFEAFLGDRKFLSGDSLTYVDFMLAEIFDFHWYLIPDLPKQFPKLKAHHDKIMNLPGVKEYIKSPSFTRWPINGRSAKFGGSGEEPKRG